MFSRYGTDGSRMCTGLHFQLSCTGAAWSMLTYADFVVLTKIDMVSQAERGNYFVENIKS